MKRAGRWLSVLLASAGAACGGGETELRGHAIVGFELFGFQACGRAEVWYLDLPAGVPTGWDQVAPLLAGTTCTPSGCVTKEAYLEATGQLSEPGHYGHLGKFRRRVLLSEVHGAAPPNPPGCERPAPRFPE